MLCFVVLCSKNPNIQYDNTDVWAAIKLLMLATWNFGVRNHSSKAVKPCTHIILPFMLLSNSSVYICMFYVSCVAPLALA